MKCLFGLCCPDMAGFPLPGASGLFIQEALEGGASHICFLNHYRKHTVSCVPVISSAFEDREPIDAVVAGSY